jgi:hypothetical protein
MAKSRKHKLKEFRKKSRKKISRKKISRKKISRKKISRKGKTRKKYKKYVKKITRKHKHKSNKRTRKIGGDGDEKGLGWWEKMGRVNTDWKERFFTIDDDFIYYYKDAKKRTKPDGEQYLEPKFRKGKIELKNKHVIRVDGVLNIKGRWRTYYLKPNTKEGVNENDLIDKLIVEINRRRLPPGADATTKTREAAPPNLQDNVNPTNNPSPIDNDGNRVNFETRCRDLQLSIPDCAKRVSTRAGYEQFWAGPNGLDAATEKVLNAADEKAAYENADAHWAAAEKAATEQETERVFQDAAQQKARAEEAAEKMFRERIEATKQNGSESFVNDWGNQRKMMKLDRKTTEMRMNEQREEYQEQQRKEEEEEDRRRRGEEIKAQAALDEITPIDRDSTTARAGSEHRLSYHNDLDYLIQHSPGAAA